MNTDQNLDQHQPPALPLQDQTVHVALIEWGSADCREPSILLATTRYGAATSAVEELQAAWCKCCGDDPQFLAEHPISADWNEAETLAWLDALREATTVPWVTLSTEPLQGDASAEGGLG